MELQSLTELLFQRMFKTHMSPVESTGLESLTHTTQLNSDLARAHLLGHCL